MANIVDQPHGEAWHAMLDFARRALPEAGYEFARQPKAGRTVVWEARHEGEMQTVAVRTSRDRWFAFNRTESGWKTLDDVDLVCVVTIDEPKDPKEIEVYLFPADEVRQRFDAYRSARLAAGHKNVDGFGCWLGLDPHDPESGATAVGSGLAAKHAPIATYPLPAEAAEAPSGAEKPDRSPIRRAQETISDVIADARARISRISGVPEDQVRLELHIG